MSMTRLNPPHPLLTGGSWYTGEDDSRYGDMWISAVGLRLGVPFTHNNDGVGFRCHQRGWCNIAHGTHSATNRRRSQPRHSS